MMGGQEVKWSISENVGGRVDFRAGEQCRAGWREGSGEELGRRGGVGQDGGARKLGAHLSPFHPYDPSDHEFHPHPRIRRETETERSETEVRLEGLSS